MAHLLFECEHNGLSSTVLAAPVYQIALALLSLHPQVPLYLARKKTDLSINEIGVFFAGRHYTADRQLVTLFEERSVNRGDTTPTRSLN